MIYFCFHTDDGKYMNQITYNQSLNSPLLLITHENVHLHSAVIIVSIEKIHSYCVYTILGEWRKNIHGELGKESDPQHLNKLHSPCRSVSNPNSTSTGLSACLFLAPWASHSKLLQPFEMFEFCTSLMNNSLPRRCKAQECCDIAYHCSLNT